MNVSDLGRGLRVHCYRDGFCYCSDDNSAYTFDVKTGAVSKIFELPSPRSDFISKLKDTAARSWLRRKLFPSSSFDNLVVLSNGRVFVVYDRIYCFDSSAARHRVQVLGCTFEPPFETPLRGGVAEHLKSGLVYFGEYVNDSRGVVRIFRVDVIAGNVEVCWVFGDHEIKHVHAIHYDKFRDRLWILTGDRDCESAFYYTDDEFQSVHRFAGGDQTWRAIAVIFDENGMEWGTDAGKDAPIGTTNRIFRYEFSSGIRRELAVIDNPAYAMHEFDDGTALMQTGYEGGVYGSADGFASLWYRGRNAAWRKLFQLPFHLNPRSGEGAYAQILIPKGVGVAGHVLCTPVNVEEFNYSLLLLTDYDTSPVM